MSCDKSMQEANGKRYYKNLKLPSFSIIYFYAVCKIFDLSSDWCNSVRCFVKK